MKPFYEPSDETLEVLNSREWVASYSGGKDSTSLVTWVEWLRRCGRVRVETPRLVMSDTKAEYPEITALAREVMDALADCGWSCEVVEPRLRDKLYNQIFGRGTTPIHPAAVGMRWCTRATKVDPMTRYSKSLGEGVVQLSGVRWGESEHRDGMLRTASCHAGGECGLPQPGDRVYSPLLSWKTCQVIDWLEGGVAKEVREAIKDLRPLMTRLLDAYHVRVVRRKSLRTSLPVVQEVHALRFGCVGCPALSRSSGVLDFLPKVQRRHLKRLYRIWDEARRSTNRVRKYSHRRGRVVSGPLKMEARKKLFTAFLQIQADAGVRLITDEDEDFIRKCWEDKVYPRGWSEEDEK